MPRGFGRVNFFMSDDDDEDEEDLLDGNGGVTDVIYEDFIDKKGEQWARSRGAVPSYWRPSQPPARPLLYPTRVIYEDFIDENGTAEPSSMRPQVSSLTY